jgi:uncharacterized protein (TIGR00725 family)
MQTQIAVIGSDEDKTHPIDPRILGLAEEVGREIGRKGAILLCGGRGGVMEAAAKGAIREGGITVGILPSMSKNEANEYIKVTIPSGTGPVMRGSLIIRAADAIITIGGGVGTLGEIACAYAHKRPIVGLRGSGGWTDKLVDSYLDDRRLVRMIGGDSPKEVVDIAMKQAHSTIG